MLQLLMVHVLVAPAVQFSVNLGGDGAVDFFVPGVVLFFYFGALGGVVVHEVAADVGGEVVAEEEVFAEGAVVVFLFSSDFGDLGGRKKRAVLERVEGIEEE